MDKKVYDHVIQELSQNQDVFKSLLSGLKQEEYLWKPQPDKWCLLEIVCHLHDEEREDFRSRLKHVFESQDKPLPSIDPAGWVQSRKYMGQDYIKMLDQFLQERKQSVKWLSSLQSPSWDNAYQHAKFGSMTAKMFLCNWLAHDHLHIRQIIKLKYDHLKHLTDETLDYAGNW